ncbi:Ataxin 2, SM domain [Dillenia turbinata]|uniref:Ataxin 2, SM domain n=1 Tax=Dillenia turbinata TaxID=194707 RepID=A0AAN8VMJ4_9MAGN
MGCRNRVLSDDSSAISASLGDALLFTTMCIIGLPVDVHIKDGSVYSGIFYTASGHKGYDVVLKKAKMIKKGRSDANVADGGLVETLVVLSGDLVQIGIMLPADIESGKIAAGDREATEGIQCPESKPKNISLANAKEGNELADKTRSSTHIDNRFAQDSISEDKQTQNGFQGRKMVPKNFGNAHEVQNGKMDGIHSIKREGSIAASANGRQVQDDQFLGHLVDHEQNFKLLKEKNIQVEDSNLSLLDRLPQLTDLERNHVKVKSKSLLNGTASGNPAPSVVEAENQCSERPHSADISSSDSISSGVDTTLRLSLGSSAAAKDVVPLQGSVSSKTAKEFKLNPEAKVFSPSFVNKRSATPAVQTVTSVAYIPNNSIVVPKTTAPPEVGISPFVPSSSPPLKVASCGNLVAGNSGSSSQYTQPVVGNVGNRTQPVRYPGQHPVQGGPAFVHPNSQNIIVGRFGQHVYMHPFAHDVVQSAAALSQAPARPVLSPHQSPFLKHQVAGSAVPQALQLCVTPPFMATGQQPMAVRGHIPLSQLSFPAIVPIPLLGANGLYNVKLP